MQEFLHGLTIREYDETIYLLQHLGHLSNRIDVPDQLIMILSLINHLS